MDGRKMFEKYYSRLAFEGFLKSLLCGVSVALVFAFVLAFGLWFTDIKVLWICVGSIVGVTVITTPIFYFKRFRPDAKAIARRLDRLGLEERLITMTELDGEDSYIATRQREDAKLSLNKVDKKQIKFKFPLRLIVSACVAFVLGAGMTTLVTLSDYGIIGSDLIDIFTPEEPEVFVFISYVVEGEGEIKGVADQDVLYGGDATPVTAVADDGWEFMGWLEDFSTDPSRHDKELTYDVIYTALFIELPDQEGPPEEGDGEPSDAPQEGEGEQQGQPEEGDPSPGGNGEYIEKNMVINGETYYRDILPEYMEAVMDELAENSDKYTAEELAIILAYYNGIL